VSGLKRFFFRLRQLGVAPRLFCADGGPDCTRPAWALDGPNFPPFFSRFFFSWTPPGSVTGELDATRLILSRRQRTQEKSESTWGWAGAWVWQRNGSVPGGHQLKSSVS